MAKQRLDQLLVDRKLSESREKAQRLVRSGRVRVDGTVVSKPGRMVPCEGTLAVDPGRQFVSRGGEKLLAALEQFRVRVRDRICVDVGSSTGGFTDCLLQQGAASVYAIDVGKGQLDWNLRNDPRVDVREQINARHLDRDTFDPRPSLAVVDVSFISLTLILPPVRDILTSEADIITLIKPQFEAGRKDVGKGGVVRDPAIHQGVIDSVRSFGTETAQLAWQAVIPSPLKGPAGNVEFLAWWKKPLNESA